MAEKSEMALGKAAPGCGEVGELEPMAWDEYAARWFAEIICRGVPVEDPQFVRSKRMGLAFLAGLNAKDTIEQMLATQMLLTHARVIALNRNSMQKTAEHMELIHSLAERGANTFGRQLEALAGYRKPRSRRRQTFTTIRRAHITNQQVIAPRGIGSAGEVLQALPKLEAEVVEAR